MLATQLLPQYKCHTCNKQAKEQRGCTAKPKLPMMLDGEELERCPLRGFYEDPVGYNELFHRYRLAHQQGYLSDPGLWPDQAACFVAYANIITTATDEAQDSLRKKREKEQNIERRRAAAKGPPGGTHVPKAKAPRPPRGGRPRRR